MSDITTAMSDEGKGDRLAGAHSTAFVVSGSVLGLAAVAVHLVWPGALTGYGAASTTSSPLDLTRLLPLLAAVALLAGLPHGALDPWISWRAGLWRGVRGFVVWHAVYIAIAGAVVAAFAWQPSLALFGFLALSVHHFSGDWRAEEGGPFAAGLPFGLRLMAGSLIVIVPSVAHPQAVASIFAAITGTAAPDGPIALPYGIMLPTLWLIAGTIGAAWLVDRRAGAEIAVTVLLAVVLPPLGFFLAYFVGLHAPRHMLHERDAVRGVRQMVGVVAYTALALALCVGVTLAVFGGSVTDALREVRLTGDEILRAVFIGLAALTLPHVLLVEHAGRSKAR